MVRSPITIGRDSRMAARTSSSQTNGAGGPAASFAGVGGGGTGACRVRGSSSIAATRSATRRGSSPGGRSVSPAPAFGSRGDDETRSVAACDAVRSSYASRFTLSRWRGEMLSEVTFPPWPPHPSVIDGSSPVVMPMEPSVAGVFTTMRNAGFLSANSSTTDSSREWIAMVWPMPP